MEVVGMDPDNNAATREQHGLVDTSVGHRSDVSKSSDRKPSTLVAPPTARQSRWAKRVAGLVIAATVGTVGTCGAWQVYRASAGTPKPALEEDPWHRGHRVLDRHGKVLRELTSSLGARGHELRREQIGDRLIAATLVSEDSEFYAHDGVDRAAIARALKQNIAHGRLVSGASTITQQLVKLLDTRGVPQARGIADKLREAARAQNLERLLGKDEILVAYMNRLPYGHGLTGPDAAAKGYFGVACSDLSWAQAAFMAVLPRAPSYLDPYRHVERVRLRQKALLRALAEAGKLTTVELQRALNEPITLQPLAHPFLAPHLVEHLRIHGILADKQVTTTSLDGGLQADVEGLTRNHLAELVAAGAQDAAVIVLDNTTGEVLTYVGSADFHDPVISGQVDMIQARRQPGSTLKPFVYAMAFENGRTAADVLADVPTRFVESHGTTYTPANYSRSFEGPISAREALAGSLNVPAVRLASEFKDGTLLDRLHRLGFASLDESAQYYGLALALGSGEVKMVELARAYLALARGGSLIDVQFTRAEGPPHGGTQVFSPEVAAMVSEVLADPLARIRGMHGRGPFVLPYPVAVKTGTSSGHRDTWAVGYTHERTVAVWVGNANGQATVNLTGASGAGPLFASVMKRAMEDVEGRQPLWDPALLASAEVCPLSGKRPGPACAEHTTRMFIHDHLPSETCSMHVHVAPAKATGHDGLPWRCSAQGGQRAALFPSEYEEWLAMYVSDGHGFEPGGPLWYPRTRVQNCQDDGDDLPQLIIREPVAGSVYNLGYVADTDKQVIEVRATVEGPEHSRPEEVVFVVDGKDIARSSWPYRAQIAATPGDHELLVRPADPSLAIRLGSVMFSVR